MAAAANPLMPGMDKALVPPTLKHGAKTPPMLKDAAPTAAKAKLKPTSSTPEVRVVGNNTDRDK